MIFGHVISSRPYGSGFGDIVSEQSVSEPVKNLQSIMTLIAGLMRQPDYSAHQDTPGKVGFYTASGLLAMAIDGVANIPVIKTFWNEVIGRVGADCVRDRMRSGIDVCNMENAWDLIKAGDPDWLKKNVIDPIRSGAASIKSALQAVADRIPKPTPPGGIVPMQVVATFTPSAYPPGTVGVRDPILGKYRLITPIG